MEWQALLLYLCAGVGGVALLLTLVVWVSLRKIQRLGPDAVPQERPRHSLSDDAATGPELSIIIPARNEEAALEPALLSILEQEGVDFEVILINDHSTDNTGRIADRLARTYKRLRVIHDPELPPGWLGKVNAMQTGAAEARAQTLLFTDADIFFRTGCLAASLAEMRKYDYDFFSLLPELSFITVFENALAPVFFLAVPMFAGARLDDPTSPDAVGAGAFLMIRRETYNAIGRHEKLRLSSVDDINLARLVKRSGHRVGLRLAPRLLACRMYLSNRQAFWAVEKNIMDSVEGKPWAPYLLLPGIVVYAWTAPVTAVFGLAMLDPKLIAAGVGLHVFQSMSFLVTRGFYRFKPMKLFLYPLGTISLAACIARATMHRIKGGVVWRGRVVKLDG